MLSRQKSLTLNSFKTSRFTYGIAFALLSTHAVAENSIERIVVTGSYKASLAKNVDEKRNAIGIQDSIVAEDIGKFPDLNLAEALQRITGVAISRNNGEGSRVSIRGLAPEFTLTTLNGMVISTANRGREFNFDLLPSELFSRLDAYKTSKASLEEGGMGGTVGLSLPRPFSNAGFHASASVQANYSDLAGDTNPRAHLIVSNTFGDFGANFQLALSERTAHVEGASTVGWTRASAPSNGFEFSFPNGAPEGFSEAQLNDAFLPRLARPDFAETERQRIAMSMTLQWQPSDSLDITLDGLHAKLKNDGKRYNLNTVIRGQKGKNAIIAVPEAEWQIDAAGNLVKGTLDGVERISENRIMYDETDLIQMALNVEWQPSEKLTVSGVLGSSMSEFDNPFTISHLFQVENSRISFDYTDILPSIKTPVDLIDPANYVTLSPRIRAENIQDTAITAKFDISYQALDSVTLKTGMFINQYEKERIFKNNDGFNDPSQRLIPVSAYSKMITNFDNIKAPKGFPSQFLVADFDKAESIFGSIARASSGRVVTGSSGTISENTSGFYVETDIKFNAGDLPALLNLGGRFVSTEQISQGSVAGITVDFDNKYDNFLPSINFDINVNYDLKLRASASRSITRPSLGNLLPAISVNGNNRSASGGNPKLKPFEADQLDVAAEWYFDEDALLSLTFFYKDIKSFIVTENSQVPYGSLGIPLEVLDQTALDNGVNNNTSFTFRRPINGKGADLRGVELSYQQPMDYLLDGLGVIANYTYANSKTEFASRTDGTTFANGKSVLDGNIPGLSQNTYNLVVYYENDLFGGRLAYNWRSDYVQSSAVTDNTGFLEQRDSAGLLDASAYYNLTENIKLTFEAINLTNEAEFIFDGEPSRLNSYIKPGRQFSLGVRAKF